MSTFMDDVRLVHKTNIYYWNNGRYLILGLSQKFRHYFDDYTPTASGYFKTPLYKGRLFKATTQGQFRVIKPADVAKLLVKKKLS